MNILYSIPQYLVRFIVIVLPVLGITSSGTSSSDTTPETKTELKVDIKSGGGITPLNSHSACIACPPNC